jgi:stage V sporulation protein S
MELKVSSKSNPASVAGAITGAIKTDNHVTIYSIGAGAINQAIKAVAIARGFVAPSGKDLVCIPSFADTVIDDKGRTVIRLTVKVSE